MLGIDVEPGLVEVPAGRTPGVVVRPVPVGVPVWTGEAPPVCCLSPVDRDDLVGADRRGGWLWRRVALRRHATRLMPAGYIMRILVRSESETLRQSSFGGCGDRESGCSDSSGSDESKSESEEAETTVGDLVEANQIHFVDGAFSLQGGPDHGSTARPQARDGRGSVVAGLCEKYLAAVLSQ